MRTREGGHKKIHFFFIFVAFSILRIRVGRRLNKKKEKLEAAREDIHQRMGGGAMTLHVELIPFSRLPFVKDGLLFFPIFFCPGHEWNKKKIYYRNKRKVRGSRAVDVTENDHQIKKKENKEISLPS